MKHFASSSLVILFGLNALLPVVARADADDAPIVEEVRIVETSGADTVENAAKAEALHAEWLKELAAHPENTLLAKAEKNDAFRKHPEKMRCWVSGFSAVISGQTGVCKSAGRKYAFSALGIGVGAEVHTGRLKLVSNTAFPDSLTIGGERASGHFIIGFEAYGLHSSKTGTEINAHGFGLGFGAGVELVWVTLSRMN
ncbi:MAG: hypothetical protein JST04_09460 [Bdellovibrionales bacterium]|nr:hypothetical protein [Bdellovibrionales bacterium]